MDKQDNPYMNLIEIIRQQGQANQEIPFMVGTVISCSPFLVQVDTIQLERRDLLINTQLLSHERKSIEITAKDVQGDVRGSRYDGELANFHMLGEIKYLEDDFKVGDKLVLLVSQDQQQFIVLAKVR